MNTPQNNHSADVENTTASSGTGTTTGSSRLRRTLFSATAGLTAITLLAGCALSSTNAEESTDYSFGSTVSTSSVSETDSTESDADSTESSSVSSEDAAEVQTVSDAMEENQEYWTADESSEDTSEQTITLDGDSASTDSDSVDVDGSTVTITEAGTYRVSGSFEGQLVVDAADEDQVVLIFDDAEIASDQGPAVLLENAEGVQIQLAEGSENSVTDARSDAQDDDADVAIYADTNLQISGSGSLNVSTDSADGIVSTDDLVVDSGDITVEAAGHGMRGKDALVITSGTVTVDAGGDALRSTNEDDEDSGYVLISGGTLQLTAEQDAIDAASDLLVSGGSITAQAGGGSSAEAGEDDASTKGLKAGSLVVIDDGEIDIDALDDSVHSDGSVFINGGTLDLATGDDGVHADHTLSVGDAELTVSESYEGLEATYLFITDGDVDITASDDGLNASYGLDEDEEEETATDSAETTNSEMQMDEPMDMGEGGGMPMGEESSGDALLEISGGTLVVDAEGDGIDSNGDLLISGGEVIVYGTTAGGNGAFDADGEFTLDGGTVVATSAGSMEETPSAGDQSWVDASASGDAGDAVVVSDSSGEELTSFTSEKSYGYVFYSDDSVTEGESYTVESSRSSTDSVAGESDSAGMFGEPGEGGPGQGDTPPAGAEF